MAAESSTTVAAGFQNPPDSAKPLTWWHWIDGNLTKEGITADLESMKRIGLGGAYLFNVAMGMPQGPARFLQPEWLAMMDHALKEAARLNLEFGIHNCDGWGQSGGPWITPETAMKKLTWTVKEVTGPVRINDLLTKPESEKDFYRDIAVIAFPVPHGNVLSGQGTDTVMRGSLKPTELAKLVDGKTATTATFAPNKNGNTIEFVFSAPRTVRSLVCANVEPSKAESGLPIVMEVSSDGKTFRTVGAFTGNWEAKHKDNQVTAACEEATGTVFRLTLKNPWTMSIGEITLSETARVHFAEAKATWMRGQGHGAERGYHDAFPGPDRERKLSPELTLKRDEVQIISSTMAADGRLQWDVPPGAWRIIRLGYTINPREVAPATDEGRGMECNKLDAEAVRFHLGQYVEKIANRPERKALVALEVDSWECGIQNWTAGFEQRFRERIGYDLLPFMPTFLEGWVVDNADVSERVLWDWRRFLSDQFAEQYFSTVQAFAKENGLTYVGEAAGQMQFLYDVAALRHTDVPMGEFWQAPGGGNVRLDIKAASSIAHTTGKPVVSAESYTGGSPTRKPGEPGSEGATWNTHPFSLKPLGDRAFCAGVNQYVFHTFAHQPYTVTGPGFTFGQWGLNFNRANTWWEPGRAWMSYLTRCNYLLRAGNPACDVLFFVGDDVPNVIGWRDDLHPELPTGYDFDGCDALALMEARVEKNEIVLPSGPRYRVLLLPNLPTMRPAVMKKIQELVTAGAVVIGRRPTQSPCLQDLGAGDQVVRETAEALWNGTEHHVYSDITFAELFKRIDLAPDFAWHATSGDSEVLYTHRRLDDADLYFAANQSDSAVTGEIACRAGNRAPELWDPATGEIRPLPNFRTEAGVVHVPMQFDPYGSTFIVFRGERQPTSGSNWPKTKRAATLTGPWQVQFPPKLGAPASATLDTLSSLSSNAVPGIKFFSGTATYTHEFTMTEELARQECWLDLGTVAVIAEVELNGKNLGILWKPPFRVRVDGVAQAGTNKLVIKVTNQWRNRMIGDEALPQTDVEWKGKGKMKGKGNDNDQSTWYYPEAWPEWLVNGQARPSGRVTFCTRRDVYSVKEPLLESGLIGPVTLHTSDAR